MFWRKNKEGRAVVPEEQGGQAAAKQPDAVMAAPPDDAVAVAPVVDTIPASLVREPLVAPGETPATNDLPPSIETAQLEGRIIAAISSIFDPEIPVPGRSK